MQNIPTKNTGESLTAVEWNQIPDELENAITNTGIALSVGDLSQLSKAIANYVASGDFYTESGAADAYVLSVLGSKQAPTAYVDGMKVRFDPGNDNTGASTVNVASIGVKNIKTPQGNDPLAGDIAAGLPIILQYDLANGYFIIYSVATGGATNQVFTGSFISAEQTITVSGSLALAHGLGVSPSLFQCRLICKIAEKNYSVGDEFPVPCFAHASTASNGYGTVIVPDATNLNIRFGDRNPPYFVLDKNTGSQTDITLANWKLIVRAWA